MNYSFIDNTAREFSVSEISRNIKKLLEENFTYIKIKGEIVNFKQSNLGHIYFSLKEGNDAIFVVCFKSTVNFVDFQLEDGLSVIVTGRITTYSGRSSYQIIAEVIKKDGLGNIIKNLEELKIRLRAEGFFDLERKKTIPAFPKRVGIITSEFGAAIEDIMSRLEARLAMHILLYPALVQGERSPKEIITGIKYFNNLKNNEKPDVLVITRGGGSFEDLIYFNDEELVRVVAESKIPIISAVGHEIDTNLIDLVADLSVPTPTAVGEMLVPLKSELKNTINFLQKSLCENIKNIIGQKSIRLVYLLKQLKSPINTIKDKQLTLDHKLQSLNIYLNNRIKVLSLVSKHRKELTENLQNRLNLGLKTILIDSYNQVKNNKKLLNSYNPKEILKKGYAIVRDIDGNVIKSIKDIKAGEVLCIELSDGSITSGKWSIK
ncbi:exodeoxyribonuclease VII large subunit [Pseudomonadota bacterium]